MKFLNYFFSTALALISSISFAEVYHLNQTDITDVQLITHQDRSCRSGVRPERQELVVTTTHNKFHQSGCLGTVASRYAADNYELFKRLTEGQTSTVQCLKYEECNYYSECRKWYGRLVTEKHELIVYTLTGSEIIDKNSKEVFLQVCQ